MLKVVKFGGSSLCDAAHLQKAADLIRRDPARRIAVVSAPGKGDGEREKITDLLIRAREGDGTALEAVCRRFRALYAACGWKGGAEETLAALGSPGILACGRGYFISRGEYLCGRLLARLLSWHFLDAAEVVRFFPDGRLDEETTLSLLREGLCDGLPTVLPGFYGSDSEGVVHLLPRGGSDLTGALAAAAIGADLYENLTDVPGVFTADPRKAADAAPIPALGFAEMRQLSHFGAGVLQEDTLLPAEAAGVPIRLGLTSDGGASGSDLLPRPPENRPPFFARSGKGGYTLLTVSRAEGSEGLCGGVLDTLAGCGIPMEGCCAYGDTVTLLLPTASLTGLRRRLLHRLCRAVHPDLALLRDGMAALQAAGENALFEALDRLRRRKIPVEALFFRGELQGHLPLFCIPEGRLEEALYGN